MTSPADHDAYIAAAPEAFRPLLGALRAQLADALPDAEEIIAYDMPGFRVGTTTVAGYAAFTKQCGLYVAPGAISALGEDIAAAGLKATTTGITFTARRPLPEALVARLARASREEHGV